MSETQTTTIITDRNDNQKVFQQLVDKSLRHTMDYFTSVPWEQGLDKSKPTKRLDKLWLYCSTVWQQLTPEQRVEISWLETARDVSMFINLEHLIPELHSGYAKDFSDSMTREVYEYLMIFSREELMHILVFNKYLRLANMEKHPKIPEFYQLAAWLKTQRPELGITFALVIEWLAECEAMHVSQFEEIDPVTRAMFRQHHLEEVRHVHFGRKIAEAYFAAAPPEESAPSKAALRNLIRTIVHAPPPIAEYASFKFPFDMMDDKVVSEVRSSSHYQQVMRERYGEIFEWGRGLGIFGASEDPAIYE
jgi:hypothetical protein